MRIFEIQLEGRTVGFVADPEIARKSLLITYSSWSSTKVEADGMYRFILTRENLPTLTFVLIPHTLYTEPDHL